MTTGPLKRAVVYLYPTQHRKLKILAARRGVSMSELLKQLLDKELENVR